MKNLNIQIIKPIVAQNGYDSDHEEIKAGTADCKKVAVAGAGPRSQSYFCKSRCASVTVFEKEEKAGGVDLL